MDARAMKMAQARRMGRPSADMAGRAMPNPTPDRMGRAMAAPMGMKKGGEAKAKMKGVKKYARGGGVEIRGKTKGKMVKMNMGGKC